MDTFLRSNVKRCVHYKGSRSSHLKVRLQLFENTPENMSFKCQYPTYYSLPQGLVNSFMFLLPLPSPNHPISYCIILPFSPPLLFLAYLTLPRTWPREGRLAMESEPSLSHPPFSPGPEPVPSLPMCYAQQSPSLCFL